jgi:hypothetical protein
MDARWSFALPLSAGEWKAMTRYRIN